MEKKVDSTGENDGKGGTGAPTNTGGKTNLPYFFMGLKYDQLNPNDSDTHGVIIALTKNAEDIGIDTQYFFSEKIFNSLHTFDGCGLSTIFKCERFRGILCYTLEKELGRVFL